MSNNSPLLSECCNVVYIYRSIQEEWHGNACTVRAVYQCVKCGKVKVI